jgi:hypothetical protein
MFDLLGQLCQDGYDHIITYIVNHGSTDVIALGGQDLYADDLVDFLNAHPDTSFSFLIETCASGSFIDDLSELPNVKLVLTATSSIYPSSADWDPEYDPNPIDSGSEWTSSLYWGALDRLTNVGWTNILSEANRISAPPSIVLLMAAFNNAGDNDSRDLNACYLDYSQFPQAWSPYSTLCNLWQQPPLGGEGHVGCVMGLTGRITSSGSVSNTFEPQIGGNDSKRGFFSYSFTHNIPEGSTVLTASSSFSIETSPNCTPGYVGDLIIEHLTYDELDRSDFNAPAEEISRFPVYCTSDDIGTRLTVQLGSYFQQDINNHRSYSQYRISFTGASEITVDVPDVTFHYELR